MKVLSRWLLASVAIVAAGSVSANDSILKNEANPNNWASQLGNYAGQRYSPLNQITTDNVKNLQVAWSFSTGVLRGHEGGPIVVGDVMYIHTPFPNKVFALDLNNPGRVIWKYESVQDPTVIPVMCCDTVNRGVAVADGKVFLAQADNTLVALDAKTGKEMWKAKNGDHTKGETLTAAPLVVKDKVFVGISGGEFGVRGHLTAYDTNSGKMVWRAFSTGPDTDVKIDPSKTMMMGKPIGQKDLGVSTWPGEEWKRGGGTTWGWYTYDPALNLIYYGTGNPGTWNPTQRAVDKDRAKSDNKWSMTIFARDPDTGEAKWVYQKTPFDEWDFDGVNENILADINMNGQQRKVLVNFDRNGFAYTLDRATGELLVAQKFDPTVNWATDVDMKTGRPNVVDKYSTFANGEDKNTAAVCPAALGSKDQQPASFSPDTGLFYVPTNHICMDYEPFSVSYTAGQAYVGSTVSMYPTPNSHGGMGNFIAWDAAAGKIVWSRPERFAVWSGALSTKGGVAYYGTLEGYLVAVDMKDGKELWRFKTPSGIIGNINTYTHNGKQYVAVLSGVGGWAGIGLAAGLTQEAGAQAWHNAVHPGHTEGGGVATAGLGAVGAHQSLGEYTQLGGVLTVFHVPDQK
ncbi:PQQ-dependent dehydrogenase (methanol/ethanol family) [Azospirillum brasilense]|uniref:PQQ-dependent dehydrogenase (Methanol/ethanol family) n=1 Tax=Azospirillum brasilense TaxID=192 RepID=A0A560C3Z8_AZOBR|nr:methanol/ethanol family PQQ-dependent dehydrogenase [Azospirillum brasilense]MBK3734352.1 PQQ-dependent dehydrogenase, methanol/ethanol family [Azospirillum brasilense]TWA79583.1 PQQ-dependent dehydrogenase (methanol/ethanol family) [Azospirillum brasilense]